MKIKTENFVHDIKTAGVIAGLSLTLNACHERPLTQQQIDTISCKTDSAVKKHQEYIFAENLKKLSAARIDDIREKNRKIVKRLAKAYIVNTILNPDLRHIMIQSINNETVVFEYSELFESEYEFSSNINSGYIYKNERWFYDLMMYLNNNYSDRQLLNGAFFKVIKNEYAKNMFEKNTERIEFFQKSFDSVSRREDSVYNNVWNKYAQEVKKSNQR